MDAENMEDMELVLLLLLLWRKKKKRRAKRFWIKNIYRQRRQYGEYHNLLQEMRLADPESHFMYMRMTKETFDLLLSVVSPYLIRKRYVSSRRPSISPAEKLALTLRFLATGNSQISLSFNFRMGRATVSKVVNETCCAIWDALVDKYLKFPQSIEEWNAISQQFWKSWNFPNCLGAIDGKHVVIQAPNNSGSTYFNYKGTYSIVLLAACDAYYRFIMVDIGGSGRESDGGILSYSSFGLSLELDSIKFPDPVYLPDQSELKAPYVFLGDEGFPLGTKLLKPFPRNNITKNKSIFNYRLSRARRTIENAFGILSARFRLFKSPINATPDHVVNYVKACVIMHNFLRVHESPVYCPAGFTDTEDVEGNVVQGHWRQQVEDDTGFSNVASTKSNRSSWEAMSIRDTFMKYFLTKEGEVPWQNHHVQRVSYN